MSDGANREQREGDAGQGAEGVEDHVGCLAGAAGDEQLVDFVGGGVESCEGPGSEGEAGQGRRLRVRGASCVASQPARALDLRD